MQNKIMHRFCTICLLNICIGHLKTQIFVLDFFFICVYFKGSMRRRTACIDVTGGGNRRKGGE